MNCTNKDIGCPNKRQHGMYCPECDAVNTIRIHFNSYRPIATQQKLMLEDWTTRDYRTGEQLYELGVKHNAKGLRELARKIQEQEAKAGHAIRKGRTILQRAIRLALATIAEGMPTPAEQQEAMSFVRQTIEGKAE